MIPSFLRSIRRYDTAPPVVKSETGVQAGTELPASRGGSHAAFALFSTTAFGSAARESAPMVFVVAASGLGFVNCPGVSTISDRWHLDLDEFAERVGLPIIDSDTVRAPRPGTLLADERLPASIESVLTDFAVGVGGKVPSRRTQDAARRIATEASKYTKHPDLTVDVDGALSFDMRAMDGRVVFAEMDIDGGLDVGVYSDAGQMLDHDAQATEAVFFAAIKPDAGTR